MVGKVESAIDFNFIHDLVADLYCAGNGRSALDPTRLFKLLLLGYLFGIRSEWQLMREVRVNMAYRWFFCWLGTNGQGARCFHTKPESPLRFDDSSVYQDTFDEIVLQAMKKKLVNGNQLYTDSIHLKGECKQR